LDYEVLGFLIIENCCKFLLLENNGMHDQSMWFFAVSIAQLYHTMLHVYYVSDNQLLVKKAIIELMNLFWVTNS
jgi:hypothetical protein